MLLLLLINLLSPGWEIVMEEEVLLGRVLAVRWREWRSALHLSPQLLHQLGVTLLHLLGQLLPSLKYRNKRSLTNTILTTPTWSRFSMEAGGPPG